MSTNISCSIRLTEFKFPDDLDDNKADFRLQVDLRFRDATGGIKTKTVILPGLDRYWECSKDENKKGKYKPEREIVRKLKKGNKKDEFEPEVDLSKVGEWGKVFRVQAAELYEMRVTVFDVDHKGWWDKIASAVSNVFSSIVRFVVPGGNAVLDSVVGEATTSIGRIMVNDDNRVLFVGSGSLIKNESEGSSGSWTIQNTTVPPENNFQIVFKSACKSS